MVILDLSIERPLVLRRLRAEPNWRLFAVENVEILRGTVGSTSNRSPVTISCGSNRRVSAVDEAVSASASAAMLPPPACRSSRSESVANPSDKSREAVTSPPKQVRERVETETFEPLTTTTDSQGRFEFTISDANLKRVGVVAYRAPDGLDAARESETITFAGVRDYYESTNTTTSVALPAGRTTTTVPETNLSVRVREA